MVFKKKSIGFKLFVISVDFLIMGSAKAILSFIHRLLAAG
jgi:hypothetical protein